MNQMIRILQNIQDEILLTNMSVSVVRLDA